LLNRDSKGRFIAPLLEMEAQEFVPAPKLYFGYGSNLDILQMKRRCHDCVPLQAAKLPGYLLTFSGVLTIARDPVAFVLGGVYQVSDEDEGALDSYEGYPHLYVKRYTHVTIAGTRQMVFYYVMPEDSYNVAPPPPSYYAACARGYFDWGLDVRELEAARTRSWVVRKSFYELSAASFAARRQVKRIEPAEYITEID